MYLPPCVETLLHMLLREMGSASVCEGAELSVGNEYLRGCQVLCRFGLSLGPLTSGCLDPTLASFCSLTLVITPQLLLAWHRPSLRSHVTRTQFLVTPPGAASSGPP